MLLYLYQKYIQGNSASVLIIFATAAKPAGLQAGRGRMTIPIHSDPVPNTLVILFKYLLSMNYYSPYIDITNKTQSN